MSIFKRPSTPANAGETKTPAAATDQGSARRKAAEMLNILFVSDGQGGKGMLHQYSLAALEAAGWGNFIAAVRGNEHAKTLALLMSARANSAYSPALVAELFTENLSPEEGEKDDTLTGRREWLSNVYLSGLAEIYVATDRIRGGQSNVAIQLPIRGNRLDLFWGAFNVCRALTPADIAELGLFKPGQCGQRKHSNDSIQSLLDETAERKPASPAQKLYLWVEKTRLAHGLDEDGRRRKLKVNDERWATDDNNPTSDLPKPASSAGGPPAPPVVEAKPGIPPPPAGTASVAPKSPSKKEQRQAPPPPPASSAGETASSADPTNGTPPILTAAIPAADDDQDTVITALVNGGPVGKALAAMVRQGSLTLEAAAARAAAKNLPGF